MMMICQFGANFLIGFFTGTVFSMLTSLFPDHGLSIDRIPEHFAGCTGIFILTVHLMCSLVLGDASCHGRVLVGCVMHVATRLALVPS